MVDTPENSIDHASTTAAATAEADNGHSSAAQEVPEPTFRQLLRVGVTKGIPFVAFGFFDNIIMITAGEQIDLMFGAKLGLSSMAAAGLGNTVADVVGINISHTIEVRASCCCNVLGSLCVPAPALHSVLLAAGTWISWQMQSPACMPTYLSCQGGGSGGFGASTSVAYSTSTPLVLCFSLSGAIQYSGCLFTPAILLSQFLLCTCPAALLPCCAAHSTSSRT